MPLPIPTGSTLAIIWGKQFHTKEQPGTRVPGCFLVNWDYRPKFSIFAAAFHSSSALVKASC